MAKVAQNDQCLRSNRTGRNILTGGLRNSVDSRRSDKSTALPDVGGIRGGACRAYTRPTCLAETAQRHALTGWPPHRVVTCLITLDILWRATLGMSISFPYFVQSPK
jgi:hypothetical protein